MMGEECNFSIVASDTAQCYNFTYSTATVEVCISCNHCLVTSKCYYTVKTQALGLYIITRVCIITRDAGYVTTW